MKVQSAGIDSEQLARQDTDSEKGKRQLQSACLLA